MELFLFIFANDKIFNAKDSQYLKVKLSFLNILVIQVNLFRGYILFPVRHTELWPCVYGMELHKIWHRILDKIWNRKNGLFREFNLGLCTIFDRIYRRILTKGYLQTQTAEETFILCVKHDRPSNTTISYEHIHVFCCLSSLEKERRMLLPFSCRFMSFLRS